MKVRLLLQAQKQRNIPKPQKNSSLYELSGELFPKKDKPRQQQ